MQQDVSQATLFEVSWEVCNKVGGIYAVVSSKALEAAGCFGENYYLLGPDCGNNAGFEETDEACWVKLREVATQRNLSCRFGRWSIPGRPKVILVNYRERYNQGQLLYSLWNRYGIDSISGGWDYAEPVMFSTACGEVIEAACQTLVEAGSPVIAHFHEWMCGGGLLHLKAHAPSVATVFTTHATMLGRSMAGSGFDIYRQMNQINPKQEAGAYNITAKCSMETASAREADCFTTVSRITSDEASVFLGRAPDVLTLNGIDIRVIPDYSADREAPVKQRGKLLAAAGKLLRRELAPDTRLFMISGRYEFHNKGIDVFLDALAAVNEALRESKTNILALCAVMGGHSGVNPDAVGGDPSKHSDQGPYWITSHHVYNQPEDPILNACRRLTLDNRPDNHVQVIFVPAQLDGHDGFLNMTYGEVLAACDLGVFPSWYEPWGYTPQECAAHAVPTVTTDLSGFGLWVREFHPQEKGVTILHRRQTSYEDTVSALRGILLDYAAIPGEELDRRRASVRALSTTCSWEQFFANYIRAYGQALDKAAERGALGSAPSSSSLTRVLEATMSTTPTLHSFTAVTQLPEAIGRLRELARNLWWCWHPECHELFTAINPEVWESSGHNPVLTIGKGSSARLLILAHKQDYLRLYRETMAAFDAYMAVPPQSFGELSPDHPLAYFSTEYGLTECLPIYSGGLGVLSGDHLKSSSDLNIPLLGVGLLYRSGYFRQQIDKDGRQTALYPENDFSTLPVELLKDSGGAPLYVTLDLPGRRVYAQVWLVRVGRIRLYLLDTDTPRNTADDRKITARLYEADRDMRLRQEILLGMGGVRLMRKLHIRPAAFHMNEGHSAFLIFERIRMLMQEEGLSFAEAGEIVRGSSLFTTHTPVDAGNERFAPDRIEHYFKPYAQSIGIPWQDFVRTARFDDSERNSFEMTVLALKYAFRANGVSALHGAVSRNMWQEGWKGIPAAEIPIAAVTNGIHVPSYVGPAMRVLLDHVLDDNWQELPPDSPLWSKILDIPDDELWAVKLLQKKLLLDTIRASLPECFKKFSIPYEKQKAIASHLTTSALVIGFARRFAPYKRATLLFADADRLASILSRTDRPVIIVFAGKAHPADNQGIDMLQDVIRHMLEPRFLGRLFFIEDYSLRISRLLVQGCDVWLNTPRRPYEACGTSGQKVPVNAGINLSISDGWWCEGYNGKNGWTIGPVVHDFMNTEQNDYEDAAALYDLLEEKVLPLYFDRSGDTDLPHNWLEVARQSMMTLTAQFNSNRMVSDYLKDYYIPAAKRHAALCDRDMALARHLAAWKQGVQGRFNSLKLSDIQIDGISEEGIVNTQPLEVRVTLTPGTMKPEELLVQFVAGPGNGKAFTDTPDTVELTRTGGDGDSLMYSCTYSPTRSGPHIYGIRVFPVTPGLDSPLDSHLVLWG